jgi:hypothetical protein
MAKIKKPNLKKITSVVKNIASRTPLGMAVNLTKGVAKCKGKPSCVANEAKKTTMKAIDTAKIAGKAAYKYTGAADVVSSGKALSKCKHKDAKCIAENLGKMAMAAKGLTPSGLASTVAKNIVKEQIKKKLDAEKAKREAQKKLAQAKTSQEKAALQKQIQESDQTINAADAGIEASQKTIADADAERNLALQQIENAKLDPATAKQADLAAKQANAAEASPDFVTPQQTAPDNSEALDKISQQLKEKTIMGIPQSKFFLFAGGLAFFILLLLIIVK